MAPRIREVRFRAFDIPLAAPFGIATGAQEIAANVLFEVELEDGTVGLGEAAPFPAVNGETQAAVLATAADAGACLRGLDPGSLRRVAAAVREAAPQTPTTWCALETAALDAFARRHGFSLFHYFGGAVPVLETDITIVTGSGEAAFRAAHRAALDGFRTLKVKVGGTSLADDVARLSEIARAAPECRWILDGNTAFSASEACELVEALGTHASRIALFEQPVPADDLAGMRAVFERTGIPVAADESARSAVDVARLAELKAAQVVNVKISKTGVVESLDMAAAARAHGLALMIGGMVESMVTMTTSACIAGGRGDFSYADLDTPLFMKPGATEGGYEQDGPFLRLENVGPGHGVAAGRLVPRGD